MTIDKGFVILKILRGLVNPWRVPNPPRVNDKTVKISKSLRQMNF